MPQAQTPSSVCAAGWVWGGALGHEVLYDIAIIGMGPAGALAGILLAREGFTVVGIGPSSIPESGDQRAETLSPSAIAILSQHGLRSA